MTTRHSRQGGSVLLCLLTAVLLAGCGGADRADPKPSFSPTPTDASTSSSAAVTTSSSTAVPETAENFIERWIALSTGMQNSGDTAAFAAMNSPGCSACTKLMSTVEKYYSRGGYIKAPPWTSVTISERAGGNVRAGVFDVAFSSAPTEFQASAGSVVQHTSGGSNRLAMTLRRDGDTWLVLDYLVASS